MQHDRDQWNQARLEQIDYINQKLADEGHASRTFQDVDQAMQEYYMLTGNKLSFADSFAEIPEPQLSDYLDEEDQKALQTGELVILSAGLLLTGYLTYKFI